MSYSQKRKHFFRYWLIAASSIIVAFIVLVVSIDWYIGNQFNQFIYSDINQVPKRKIGKT